MNDHCELCARPLGRDVCFDGAHIDCLVLRDALATLARNLATAAFGERCFDLGRFAGEYAANSWNREQPWYPGRGLSALHSCLDCDAPLKTAPCARSGQDSPWRKS